MKHSIIINENQNIKEFEDIRIKIDQSNIYQIESIKNSFN